VYVHVNGGAVCLISLIYWALVLLEFVVCSTALVDLTVRTLYHCVGNVICYFILTQQSTGCTPIVGHSQQK
jgi:hypothetical protein